MGWKDSGEAIRYPDGRLVDNPIATIEELAYWMPDEHFYARRARRRQTAGSLDYLEPRARVRRWLIERAPGRLASALRLALAISPYAGSHDQDVAINGNPHGRD